MMKATWSFVLYELWRHLPTLAVGWMLLVIGPLAHRLVEGRWDYWDGNWNVVGAAVAVFVVAPLLMALMAVSGWAAERSAGTLEWQIARPFSAARMFWVRLLTLVGAAGIWALVALLVHGIFWVDGLKDLLFWAPGWGGAGHLGLEFAGMCLGGGLLASALASRSGVAVRVFLGTALVLGFLVPACLLLLIPVPRDLLFMGAGAGALAAHVYGGTTVLALLAGAWVAMRRGPSDRSRILRAWKTTGTIAVFGVVASVSLALQPLRVDSSRTLRVSWLGDGVTLKFSGAPGIASFVDRPAQLGSNVPGLHPQADLLDRPRAASAPSSGQRDESEPRPRRIPYITHPVLVDRDGNERPLRRIFALVHPVFAHSGRGLAVMRHVESGTIGWLLVDRQGEVQSLDIRESDEMFLPLGWSRRGSHFAWRAYRPPTGPVPAASGLILLNEDLRIRRLPFETPSAYWEAGWIDDDRLLLTWGDRLARGWWMVISSEGKEELAPQPLPEGAILIPPAAAFSQAHDPQTTDRLDRLVLVLNGRDSDQLAHLDLRRGELRPLPVVPYAGPPFSFVSLADGSLVFPQPSWAQSSPSDQSRILRMPPDPLAEPTEVCSVAEGGHFGASGFYRGTTRSWILWTQRNETPLYACHLETGEVRVLGEEELGPLGARSVDVTEGGVLTIRGEIPLGS